MYQQSTQSSLIIFSWSMDCINKVAWVLVIKVKRSQAIRDHIILFQKKKKHQQ